MTKTQRKAKAATAARKRSRAKAAVALLKKLNPGRSLKGVTHVRVTRTKGGGVSVKPVKPPTARRSTKRRATRRRARR